MAVYIVTGFLGGGKTLCSVGRIKEYLQRGLPVATNLDLRLPFLIGSRSKKCKVFRLPDQPDLQDFETIGYGNRSYDESKNGLIVLDECGTWFNTRNWNDKNRKKIIDWLLHSRKFGWDVIFIIQNLTLLDNQARDALSEHVVYCQRTDRIPIPIISPIFSLFFGKKLPLPKIYVASIKYRGKVPVGKWITRGNDIYLGYDTKQVFSEDYQDRVYTVLPSWYTTGRYMVKMDARNIMRMTKIYFKRLSRPIAMVIGAVIAYAVAYHQYYIPPVDLTQEVDVLSLADTLSGYSITSYTNLPYSSPYYEITQLQTGKTLDTMKLTEMGFKWRDGGACRITVTDTVGASFDVTCI